MEETFEKRVDFYLQNHLQAAHLMDERMPECPDVEECWQAVAEAYLPDGMREYGAYPLVSLGWMMFIGMAVAHFWDADWARYAAQEDLYAVVKAPRGFDALDDEVLQAVLQVDATEQAQLKEVVRACAAGVDSMLRHANIAPGSREAFQAYVNALHSLYRYGMAVELHRLGYRMQQL